MMAKKEFPEEFPFWARIKINKHRTTLVIDAEKIANKDLFVHREATSKHHKGFEKIEPNPDKTKKSPMYLKRPSKLPKKMFEPHNKKMEMPQHLKEKYIKNNQKKT